MCRPNWELYYVCCTNRTGVYEEIYEDIFEILMTDYYLLPKAENNTRDSAKRKDLF